MSDNRQQVALFDICDTLYYSNTSFDFVFFFLSQYSSDREKLARFRNLLNRKSLAFWKNIAVAKLTGHDAIRNSAFSLLKGVPKEKLYEAGARFVTMLSEQKAVNETHRLLRDYQDKGYRIILCSASIDPVVEHIAASLGVESFSSRLAYNAEGTCEGLLEKDLTGKKYEAVEHKLQGFDVTLAVVSDNKTDKSLMERAHDKHIVLYKESDKDFWASLNGSYINLNKQKYLYE